MNRTVVVDSDWRFNNLWGSHLQSQSELYHVSWWYYTLVIGLIGQLRCDVIGRLSVKPRTKTNRRIAREQYTRSKAATARLLTLVKPAEIQARDWPNTNERRGMVTSTITLLSTIYRRNIKLTGTLRHVYTDYYQRLTLESWFTTLEQTPLNRSQQLPAPYKRLIDEIKQN